jgi:thiol:disulfide interchange protein DsbD
MTSNTISTTIHKSYASKIIFFIAISLLGSFVYPLSFNEPIDAKDAFTFKANNLDKNIQIDIEIDKSTYVYENSLSVFATSSNNNIPINVSHLVNLPKGEKYHEFVVIFNKVNFLIDKTLIQDKLKSDNFNLIIHYQGCSKIGFCYPPIKKEVKYNNGKISYDDEGNNKKQNNFKSANTSINTLGHSQSESELISDTIKNSNLFIILLTFFGFGLLLSLTPCVFPMIPIISSILVSYSKKQGSISIKKSFLITLVYVLAMSVAYAFAGILAGMFGANIQAYLQNPYVISIFAGVFVLLALSMFGLFHIQIPSFMQRKLNTNKANSLFGVATMGFLSALIVGPCVAPPLAGALIYIGQSGDFILGGLALFVMSIGLGVPMLVIGLGASKYMPKPGIWMNFVSQIFGVSMLGFSIYLLDRIIPTYISLSLTSLLFLVYGIYLLMRHKNLIKKISSLFFILAFIALYFNISNLTNKNDGLKFEKIKTVQELENILKNTDKKIMLDFSAAWCVSCVELEQITFKDKRVVSLLEKEYRLLKVDSTKNTKEDKKLYEKFNIFGPPALIFFDKNGIEMKSKRIIGFKNGDDFLEFINKP